MPRAKDREYGLCVEADDGEHWSGSETLAGKDAPQLTIKGSNPPTPIGLLKMAARSILEATAVKRGR